MTRRWLAAFLLANAVVLVVVVVAGAKPWLADVDDVARSLGHPLAPTRAGGWDEYV